LHEHAIATHLVLPAVPHLRPNLLELHLIVHHVVWLEIIGWILILLLGLELHVGLELILAKLLILHLEHIALANVLVGVERRGAVVHLHAV